MLTQNRVSLILRLNWAFAFAVGLLVLWAYVREPSEPGSAVFFGFSILRLVLLLFVLALLLAILVLLLTLLRSSPRAQASEKQFVMLANQRGILWISFLGIAIAYILLFLSEQRLGAFASYRERLLPILIWLTVSSVQFGFAVLSISGIDPKIISENRTIFATSLFILILFGILLFVINLTRIGLIPDNVYWQGPGAPILLHQVFLAVLVAILSYWLIERTNLRRSNKLDLVIFLSLWVFASLAWLSQPAKLTYFSLEPKEPNFQSYPFSDALIYDSTAEEFLIGKSIPADLWVKPVYSFFLALLHLFAGDNYTLLISLQVAILAIIPSLVYLLTINFDQRLAGLVAALFVIVRERNAMALSDIIQVSHSKLLLSDVFAMGAMILLVWLVVWWLQHPEERRATPIAVGGMLGLLILTRGHPILMIPFLFLVSLIALKPKLNVWFKSSLRMIFGLSIVLVPWFWHTYQLTGKFAFQDPSSPYAVNDTLVKLYAEPSKINTTAQNSPSYGNFQSQAFRSVIEHPLDITYFTSAHYFHNAIFSYIYLPGSFQIEDLSAYVKRLPFWNRGWDGSIPTEALILMFINFVVLSLGISVAWKKVNKLILVPLILGAAYNLSIAVARRSGWRFILPADWVTLVFYAIGIVQIFVIIRSIINRPAEEIDRSDADLHLSVASKQSLVMWGLPFLVIAIGLVSGYRLFPLLYPPKSPQQLLQDRQIAFPLSSEKETTALNSLLQQEGTTIMYGKALYPVYLHADEGMLNFNWPSFAPQPYNRLAFYLIGPQSTSVNLPMESPPLEFPDGASVIVIGCKVESGDLNAVSVLIQGNPPIYYSSESFETATCPLSESN